MRKIMAVAALAVFVVSATAFAQGAPLDEIPTTGISTTGKLVEMQAMLDPRLTSETAIYSALMLALNEKDTATLAVVQEELGVPASGEIGPNTMKALKTLSNAIAQARAAAAAGQKAVEAELKRVRGENRRSGSTLAKPTFTPSAEVMEYALTQCAPGTQVRWLTAKKFTCTDPVFQVKTLKAEDCTENLDGSKNCKLNIAALGAKYGREGVVPIPEPIVIPKPESTCSGFGGAMICYGLPVVAVVVTGFYVGHVIRDGSFSPVLVKR